MVELLFFSGEHCGVCKVIKPRLLNEINTKFPEVTMRIIDTNQQMEFAAQHLVFTLPVVLIMLEGKEQYRFARSFSVFEVSDKLEHLIQVLGR